MAAARAFSWRLLRDQGAIPRRFGVKAKYLGQYGMWKVAGLVRGDYAMTRLAQSICTQESWHIEGSEMVITNPAGVVIARLPLEDDKTVQS
jgi:hypothetical protein